jgi:ADP-ribose pyrophosphatase YjhB (NUDIX family)
MDPFSIIKIPVSAVVLNQGCVVLIGRKKNGVNQYSLPDGNFETAEHLEDARKRNLSE